MAVNYNYIATFLDSKHRFQINMIAPAIDYTKFEFPFLPEAGAENDSKDDDDDGEFLEQYEILQAMEDLIPDDAIFIGSLNDEVSNWTSWVIDDHFYLLPWKSDGFQWAFFRISWDDNWSKYEWEAISRISGVANDKEAVRELFTHWIARCKMDGPNHPPYRGLADEYCAN